ncbi:DDE-type integrase/transposase/recombinase [[Leptolyngbya] sp. PCC 7376]|uniref:DDE-type integrase/transposase/recombinase n=1 Tax=[Leptolyngbya] sp. PCC 7376 TaxID=111781 RepID=UPI0002F154BC
MASRRSRAQNKRQNYLWRAVDKEGQTLDILLQSKRHRTAAEKFFKRLLKGE